MTSIQEILLDDMPFAPIFAYQIDHRSQGSHARLRGQSIHADQFLEHQRLVGELKACSSGAGDATASSFTGSANRRSCCSASRSSALR